MDKKDIYEHLAKIYLDASSKRKKRTFTHPKIARNLFLVILVFIFGLTAFFTTGRFRKNKAANFEIALVLSPDIVKINFNFDPAKKEIFTLNLNQLNMLRFKTLAFSVKKANPKDNISLRVEFTSAFKEKSEIYFKDIPLKWQDYKINLSEFRGVNDWSEMLGLSFTVEEWNTKEKKGVVYIDNIRLLQ